MVKPTKKKHNSQKGKAYSSTTPRKVKPAKKKHNSQKGKAHSSMTPRKVKPAKKKHNSQNGKPTKKHDTQKDKACKEEARHPERYSLQRRGMTPRRLLHYHSLAYYDCSPRHNTITSLLPVINYIEYHIL
jgi:uncharacterized protein (DUF1684 family)